MRTDTQDVVFLTNGDFTGQFSIASGCGPEPNKASHASDILLIFRAYAFAYNSCRRAVGSESMGLASSWCLDHVFA